MQQFKPDEFATQIALNMDNAWGVVRVIIDILRKQKDGKYLIMKDPNKVKLRIWDSKISKKLSNQNNLK